MVKNILIIGLLIVIGVGGLTLIRFGLGGPEDTWLCQNGQWVKHGNPQEPAPMAGCGGIPTVSPEITQPILGGDKYEHGCIGSAGYSWCESKKKCLGVWEEACAGNQMEDESIIQAVKDQLVAKHGENAADLVITVSKTEGDYAQGGANSPPPPRGGGMWFAAKVNGTWKLVWDGNGIIICADIEPYPEFPSSMIPECYNPSTGKVVVR